MRLNDRLYRRIRGGVYHSTSIAGWRGIRERGEIQPNDGSWPFSHSQSRTSGCRHLDGISLLDLRNPPWPLVGHDGFTNWTRFLRNHHPITLLLRIDPGALSISRLFGRERVKSLIDFGMPFVPEAEVCYLGAIPVTAIQRTYLICAQKHTLFRVLSVSELTEDRLASVELAFKYQQDKLRPPPGQTRQGVLSLAILTNQAAVKVASGSDAKGPLRMERNASSPRTLSGPTGSKPAIP
jgi:hypothetical protein